MTITTKQTGASRSARAHGVPSAQARVPHCIVGIAVASLLSFSSFAADGSLAQRIRAVENGLRPAISIEGEAPVRWSLQERMAHWKVPGVSIAVVRDGKLAWAKGYGVKQVGSNDPVDTQTLFSVGSVSKVGAASITLRMVDAGALDLDRDVNEYLTRWKVPANAFTAIQPVTLRGILSHSAGLTLSGFPDFQPNEALPTVIDTLEGRPPAKTEPVRVFYTPGTRQSYSGGGTTVEQLAIESVSGLDFVAAAQKYLFTPLGMQRSTYQNPIPAERGNIAKAHDEQGRPTALPRGWETMPEMAASGLWTTPSEYARLLIALIDSYRGGKDTFLSTRLAGQMLTEVGRSRFGLGPQLDGQGVQRRFYHGGANDSYRAWFEAYPHSGNATVIVTNSSNGTQLMPEIVRAIAAAEGWDRTGTVRAPRVTLTAEAMDEFAGVYAVSESNGVLATRWGESQTGYRVWRDGATLHLGEAGADTGGSLIPVDSTRFVMESGGAPLSVEFVRNYGGHVDGLLLRKGEYALEGRRVLRNSR